MIKMLRMQGLNRYTSQSRAREKSVMQRGWAVKAGSVSMKMGQGMEIKISYSGSSEG